MHAHDGAPIIFGCPPPQRTGGPPRKASDRKRSIPHELAPGAVATLSVLCKELKEREQVAQYELRAAREDLAAVNMSGAGASGAADAARAAARAPDAALSDSERRLLNCCVKQYLVARGYRMTAITLMDEVRSARGPPPPAPSRGRHPPPPRALSATLHPTSVSRSATRSWTTGSR